MAARRYTAQELLHLRQSALCVKPPTLPPANEWMGPPPENHRNQPKNTSDRDPEDVILGPPRMAFASSHLRSGRSKDADGGTRDPDRQDRSDRFPYRNRASDAENPVGDKFRDSRDVKATAVRRRDDSEQDNEGWSTVKPRKSFGHEGAERFQSRMGGADRHGTRDHPRARDRDERDGEGGRRRNLEHASRDKDGDEAFETSRRNGLNRGKSEPWVREGKDDAAPSHMAQRERLDRSKKWRERTADDRSHDKNGDRHGGDRERPFDRKWDREREQRVEREPEWLDEPAEEKAQAHTMEDFQKFMESMKKNKAGTAEHDETRAAPATQREHHGLDAANETEYKVASAPAVESGPDKFFMAFGGGALDGGKPSAETKEAIKPKAGKSSRFMSFLTPQDDSHSKAEPLMSRTLVTTGQQTGLSPGADLIACSGVQARAETDNPSSPRSNAERAAFDMLLEKLQKSSMLSQPAHVNTTTTAAPMAVPSPAPITSSLAISARRTEYEPFQPFAERREDARHLAPQHSTHDLVSPRAVPAPVQPPSAAPTPHTLQDLLAPRSTPASQASGRIEHNLQAAAMNSSNKEFLMMLMQSNRSAREPPQRTVNVNEQLVMQMPQPTKAVNLPTLPQGPDLELDYSRERISTQRPLRGQGLPSFLDESFHAPEPVESRAQGPPTQILQRANMGGIEHHMHPFPMGPSGQQQMAPQRPMIPPPGLSNAPRNMTMTQPVNNQQQLNQQLHQQATMFTPNYAPSGFPPEALMGPYSARAMPPPPPGFFGGPPPPPGFVPPGMLGFQAHEGHVFPGASLPFDRRGMLPPGAGAYRGP